MNTGQGKSLVVAMFAVIHALRGKNVDIVTTSSELSKREAEAQAPFFDLFRLTVGENSELDDDESIKAVYSKNIVYGTAMSYKGDILRTEQYGKNVRGKRRFDVVFVDEVDSLFFDKRTEGTQLGELIPEMDYLEVALATVWNQTSLVRSHLTPLPGKDGIFLIMEDFSRDAKGVVVIKSGKPVEECARLVKDPDKFVEDVVKSHMEETLRDLNDPKHQQEREERREYEKHHFELLELHREIADIDKEMKPKINLYSQAYKNKTRKEKQLLELKSKTAPSDSSASAQHEKTIKMKEKELDDIQQSLEKDACKHLYNKKCELRKKIASLQDRLKDAAWHKRSRVIDVPNHLREFVLTQITGWTRAALSAMVEMKAACHYAVADGQAVPVRYDDTGELQYNYHLGQGLSQMLQIKEGLLVESQHLTTNFLSAYAFFRRYGSQIYGLSGTLGNQKTLDYFDKVYNVDVAVVPPYSYRRIARNSQSEYACKELRGFVARNEKAWYHANCRIAVRHATNNRPVLMICEFMAQAEYIKHLLISVFNYPSDKISLYLGMPGEQSPESMDKGEIKISTNIAGRGTDITPTRPAESHGGLHHINTFLVSTKRGRLQTAGRSGRKDDRGTTQTIVLDPAGRTIGELKALCDAEEKEAISSALTDIQRTELHDHLFAEFGALRRSLIPGEDDEKKLKQWKALDKEWREMCEFSATKQNQQSLNDIFDLYVTYLVAEAEANESQELTQDQLKILKEKYEHDRENWKHTQIKNRFFGYCSSKEKDVDADVMQAFRQGAPYKVTGLLFEKSRGYGKYERQALAELWAIWKAQMFATTAGVAKMETKEQAVKEFQKFKDMAIEYAKEGKLIQNPAYDIKKGNEYFYDDRYSAAIEQYTVAIKKDKKFSLYARWNIAHACLSREKNTAYQENAKTELVEVKKLITTSYRPALMTFHNLVCCTNEQCDDAKCTRTDRCKKCAKRGTSKHVQHQMDILGEIESHANEAIKVIDKAMSKGWSVKASRVRLSEVFKKSKTDHTQAILEAEANGFTRLFTLELVKPTPWFAIICVALLGIAQIVAGVLLTACTGGIGSGLISQGVSDLITAVRAGFKGVFNAKEWWTQKALTLALSLVSMGWDKIKTAYNALKHTVQTTVQNVTQVAEATFCSAVKDGMKALGCAAATQVAAEIVYEIADATLGDWAIDQLRKLVQAAVRNSIKDALKSNPLIQRALSLDLKRDDNHFLSLFINEGYELLERLLQPENPNRAVEFCKALMVNKSKDPALASKLMKGLDAAEVTASAIALTKTFSSELGDRISLSFGHKIEFEEECQKEKESRTSSAASTSAAAYGSQKVIVSPPNIPLTSSSVVPKNKEGQSFSTEISADVPELNQRYSNPNVVPTIEELVERFESHITNKICGSVRNKLLDPAIRAGANWTVDKLMSKWQAGIDEKCAQRWMNYHLDTTLSRPTEKRSSAGPYPKQESKAGSTVASQAITDSVDVKKQADEKLSPLAKEALIRLIMKEKLGKAELQILCAIYKCDVHIFNTEEKLFKTIKNYSGKAKYVVHMTYDPTGEGHYTLQSLSGTASCPTDRYTCLTDVFAAGIESALGQKGLPGDAQRLTGTDVSQSISDWINWHPEKANELYEARELVFQNHPKDLLTGGYRASMEAKWAWRNMITDDLSKNNPHFSRLNESLESARKSGNLELVKEITKEQDKMIDQQLREEKDRCSRFYLQSLAVIGAGRLWGPIAAVGANSVVGSVLDKDLLAALMQKSPTWWEHAQNHIPVYGSGRSAYRNWRDRNYVSGVLCGIGSVTEGFIGGYSIGKILGKYTKGKLYRNPQAVQPLKTNVQLPKTGGPWDNMTISQLSSLQPEQGRKWFTTYCSQLQSHYLSGRLPALTRDQMALLTHLGRMYRCRMRIDLPHDHPLWNIPHANWGNIHVPMCNRGEVPYYVKVPQVKLTGKKLLTANVVKVTGGTTADAKAMKLPVDVLGKKGEYITVISGKGETTMLAQYEKTLERLKTAADGNGVKAQAYYPKGTHEDFVKMARKVLGPENVFQIPE